MTDKTEETMNEMPKVEEVPQFNMPSPEQIAAAGQIFGQMQQQPAQRQQGIPPKVLWMLLKISIGFTILMGLNDLFTAWMVHLIK